MAPVSVVITTLDDRPTVRDCLDGVLRSGESVTEVLVVDRGSVDGTPDVVRRAGPPVRLLERPGSRLGDAVAAGVAEASGDVVAVVPSRAILGAGALDTETGSMAMPLAPGGTTAFGRAAAAMVGHRVPSVEVSDRRRGTAGRPAASPGVNRSTYLLPDAPAGLAAEAFRSGAGGRSARSAALVATAAVAAMVTRGWLRVVVPVGHAAATAVRAARAAANPGVAPHRAFVAGEIWDWASGAGWWTAAARRRREAR